MRLPAIVRSQIVAMRLPAVVSITDCGRRWPTVALLTFAADQRCVDQLQTVDDFDSA